MKRVIILGRRRALWATAMAVCLLSGFILTTSSAKLLFRSAAEKPANGQWPIAKGVAQGSHSNPAVFPAGSAVQPRLVESYGKLPLSFEINQGQTDATVKFLSRGSGYSLFFTGNEAVLALKKPMANGQSPMAIAIAPGSHFNPAVFPGRLRSPAAGSKANARTPDPRTWSALQALLPNLLPSGAAELYRNNAVDADCGLKDLEKPQGLGGEPCAASATTNNEPRSTNALLRMKLVGVNPHAKVSGLEELPGKSNYFIGNDPKKWRTNVPNYAKVKYANVYPGVDLVYYGNQGKLEYDFVVQPGGDPRAIQLAIDAHLGSRRKAVGSAREAQDLAPESQSAIDNHQSSMAVPLHVNGNGDLVVSTDGGEVIFHKPVVYQPATYYGPRTTNQDLVQGKYVVQGNHITFEVASYDKTRPLVIDPVLAYSTYLGGSTFDVASSLTVDGSGNAYIVGSTQSADFPTTPGAFHTTGGGTSLAFVSKLDATGSALVYSTFLGGWDTWGSAITLDASDNAYVTGTAGTNFPTTRGAFQATCPVEGGGFITKLNGDGSALLYSTYLCGAGISGIAVDASGNAYVTGLAGPGLSITPGGFQTTYGGGVDDAFVSKLNATGSALLYSTYLGGSNSDVGAGIGVDALGRVFVTGHTFSADFPVTPGAFQTRYPGTYDYFVTKLNAAGSALDYSTYLGPTEGTVLLSFSSSPIAIDASGNAYVTGFTRSSHFPTTPGAFQTTYHGGTDAFVSKLNAAGSALVYSTYLGGGKTDYAGGIAINASGNAYITGFTGSYYFPTTRGGSRPPTAGATEMPLSVN